jgi:hypothetical protein
MYTVKFSERHNYQVAFPGQRIWNFVGNRLVEAHIRGNAQANVNRNFRSRYFLRGTSVAASVEAESTDSSSREIKRNRREISKQRERERGDIPEDVLEIISGRDFWHRPEAGRLEGRPAP